jgi:hypothetical protein
MDGLQIQWLLDPGARHGADFGVFVAMLTRALEAR